MTDDQALDQYIASVAQQAKAVVCARHIPGYEAEFSLRYEAWRQANADALSQGAAVAQTRNMNSAKPPSIGSFASLGAQALEALPEDDRQRRCNELLSSVIEGKSK